VGDELYDAIIAWHGILSPTVSLTDSGYASISNYDPDDSQNSIFWTDDNNIISDLYLEGMLAVTLNER